MHGSGSMRWLVLGWGSMRCWLCYMNIYICVCVCVSFSFTLSFFSLLHFILLHPQVERRRSTVILSISISIKPSKIHYKSPNKSNYILHSKSILPNISASNPSNSSSNSIPTGVTNKDRASHPLQACWSQHGVPDSYPPPMSLRFRHKVINHILTLSCY